jgi:hypothetical protein
MADREEPLPATEVVVELPTVAWVVVVEVAIGAVVVGDVDSPFDPLFALAVSA